MYYMLTSAVKRRVIEELRNYWKEHPKYPELADHIQGKFSFKERPQYGMIIKNSGGSRVDLSADNYLGVIKSYVYLAKVVKKPGLSLEWIREDAIAIQNNGGRFPSAPGVYFIEIIDGYKFYVDPLLDVYHEPVTQVDATTFQLQHAPLAGTVRLFELPSGFRLYEGENYTLTLDAAGKPNGEIILVNPIASGRQLQADYRHPVESRGPFDYQEMFSNNGAIPGVVLAFGRRAQVGDQLAVVVQDARHPASLEYGGRWDLTFDIDILARDPYSQQEIFDETLIYLWGVLRSRFSDQGIEIMDVAMGGESEEVYDEAGNDYFYNANFSMTVQTNWGIHVPLANWIRQAAPYTVAQAREIAGLPEDEVTDDPGMIQAIRGLGLERVQDPFWSGRAGTFPVIR